MEVAKAENERRLSGCARGTQSDKEKQAGNCLKRNELPDKDVYYDKMTEKHFSRPQYKKLLRKLNEDRILVVKSIDRLGRSHQDLYDQWRMIIKDKKADIVVIDLPILERIS